MAQALKLGGLSDAMSALKKVDKTAIKDKSAPKLDGYMTGNDVSKHMNRMLDYNIESWYEALGEELTFPTLFRPITTDQARLLIEARERYEQDGESTIDVSRKALQSLRDLIAPTLTTMRGDNDSAFVKLSSRSAKDTPINSQERLKELARTYYAELRDTDDDVSMATCKKLHALLQAGTDMMRVRSAETVIDSFIRSDRISQDMRIALQCAGEHVDGMESFGGGEATRFEENVVVRRWVNIAVDMEFRGFVNKNRLVALSQYNHVIYSKRVHENATYLRDLIEKFFNERVRPRLEGLYRDDAYIVDFAVCGAKWADAQALQDGEERVWVIELNPYECSTDSALFSWKEEEKLLREGCEDGSMAYRVTERFQMSKKATLENAWREIIEEL